MHSTEIVNKIWLIIIATGVYLRIIRNLKTHKKRKYLLIK